LQTKLNRGLVSFATQAIWIEVICRSQRLLIGTVYRPPKDKDFYDTFKNILDDLWTKRNNILLIGDFNSDLMTRNKNDQGKKLQRIFNMFGLKNVIKKPTRIAASKETIIDLIISSGPSKVIKSAWKPRPRNFGSQVSL